MLTKTGLRGNSEKHGLSCLEEEIESDCDPDPEPGVSFDANPVILSGSGILK
ncbi:hypothetical protein JXQ70_03635 [bacterium]|nr:hypothetical protein [bacterium]